MGLTGLMRPPKGGSLRATLVMLALAVLVAFAIYAAITGASGTSKESSSNSSVSLLEPVGTTGISKVTLSERAKERIGIETVPVRAAGANRQVVPYSAVVYDPDGTPWTYTNPEGLTYVRERLTIDRIEGPNAILVKGPPNGTKVVSVGGMELFGAEIDFGKG